MPECWSCHVKLPDDHDRHFKVGFLGVFLCNRCECDHRTAQNNIRLPQWEANFRRYNQLNERKTP